MPQELTIRALWNSAETDHLFASGGIGFVLVSPQQLLLDASETFCRKIGYSLEELKTMQVSDYTHPDDLAMTGNLFRFVSSDNIVQIFEKRYITKSGEELWCRLRSQTIQDENGNVIARLALIEDITAQKLNDIQLEQMAAIIDASDDAIFRSDEKGIIQFWSKGAERMYGYTAAEAIGRSPSFLSATDNDIQLNSATAALFRGEVAREPDTVARHKNGTLIEISALAFPIKDNEGKIIAFAATHRDISAFKQLELQFHHAQRLETAGLLAGGIAHDFNNILTVIQGASSLLAQDLKDNEAASSTLKLIEKSSEKAGILTRQLLAFSRKQKTSPVVIDPNQLIRDNASLLTRSLGDDIRLEFNLDSTWNIRKDATHLEQILLNLAINSRHAMPSGGSLQISTENIRTEGILHSSDSRVLQYTPAQIKPGEYVKITISDNGTGIPEGTLPNIFDPFFTTKPKEKGTGLGLSVVYGMVTQAGGGISVTTGPGKGTSFMLYLPRTTESSETDAVSGSEDYEDSARKKILILEDDPGVRTLATAILSDAGYIISQAGSPKEVINGQADADVDLILSDVMMPYMSGPEFAEHWTRKHPQSRFLFMSGYFNDDKITGTLEGRTLIQKPFKPKALLEAVEQMLRN